jgi:hypothetical protein
MTKFEAQSSKFVDLRQGKELSELWVLGSNIMVRVSVYRDAYDHQSHARADVFDPLRLQWNPLVSIAYPAMASIACSHVDRSGGIQAAMAKDSKALRDQAELILTRSGAVE